MILNAGSHASAEMAAMIHAEVLSALDLLILTATVDNRREIMKIQQKLCEERPRAHTKYA